uniref:Endonuclease/exonuclease/phosphatase domain-containing protein n=3 Tax=Ditylum brightwellii TaxID=49249 RepID=A0A7S1YQT5_9STRA|mmetsp:Transcript_13797/g.20622  ORF Transcript_13797/g.20622 Transcript_13797/m.20622 type:complete len:332 (+) Transcript_13797:98-1093(+)
MSMPDSVGIDNAAPAAKDALNDSSCATVAVANTNCPNFSIMTYNVFVWGYKDPPTRQSTLDAIANSNCDIVCLQECNVGWEEWINKHEKISSIYPHTIFLHHRWMYGGKAILSKYPVRYDKNEDVSQEVFWGWYPGWRTEVLVPWLMLPSTNEQQKKGNVSNHNNEKSQQLFSTEEESEKQQKQSTTTATWIQILHLHLRAIFPSNPIDIHRQRRKEVATHWKLLHPINLQPTIVLGDFNTASGPCTRFVTDYVVQQNADAACKQQAISKFSSVFGKKRHTTCRWKFLKFHYDHIFVDELWWNVKNAHVPKTGASDHYPAVAMLIPVSSSL